MEDQVVIDEDDFEGTNKEEETEYEEVNTLYIYI